MRVLSIVAVVNGSSEDEYIPYFADILSRPENLVCLTAAPGRAAGPVFPLQPQQAGQQVRFFP